jgi:hypothetical protein
MDFKITKTRTGWAVGDRAFSSYEAAAEYVDRMEDRGMRRFGRSEEAASLFGRARTAIGGRVPRKVLGNLRGVVSPIKTVLAGPPIVHAAAGTLGATLNVQSVIPAGAQLYIAGIDPADQLISVEADGKNIFTGGPLPGPAVNPNTTNENAAPGLLIPVAITTALRVTTQSAAARTHSPYLVAPSIEVEQALDACDCD